MAGHGCRAGCATVSGHSGTAFDWGRPMTFDPKKFKGKKAGVIGLGKSGLACAKLLAAKGFDVLGSDSRPLKELKDTLGRLPGKISLEGGGHSDRLLKRGFVVKSPGISPA